MMILYWVLGAVVFYYFCLWLLEYDIAVLITVFLIVLCIMWSMFFKEVS